MSKNFGVDFSTGSIPRHLIHFSIPMLLSSFMQIGYSIINTVWVGNLVGENAVGAVGLSFPVFMLLISISMGLTTASTILVAQYYGAKDYEMVKNTINNSFSLAIIVCVFVSTITVLFSDHILQLMGTPADNLKLASGYLKITAGGFIFQYLVILIQSILRGIGDTVTPLIFTLISIIINAALDPFMIGGIGPFPELGLNGAAYASLIAQFMNLVISTVYLNRKSHIVAFNFRKLKINGRLSLLILKLGFPTMIQHSFISLGNITIVSFVNNFGSAAINAFGAVSRIDQVAFIPVLTIGSAVSTLTGQNIGAGKIERVKEVVKWGNIISTAINIVISIVVVLFSKYILIMFGLGNDAEVMEIGISYLTIVGSFYVTFGVMNVTTGVVNGAGHTMVTMALSLLGLWAIRIPVAYFLSNTSLGINGVWISMPVHFVTITIIGYIYYLSGKWKKSAILKQPVETQIIEI